VIALPAPDSPALPEGVFFASHGGKVPHLTMDGEGKLMVCEQCPEDDVPELPGFPTKKAAFLSLYRGHAAYGVRDQASPVAAELAPLTGLQPGTGRTYVAEELRRLADLNGSN
jgi:hypothetical protein